MKKMPMIKTLITISASIALAIVLTSPIVESADKKSSVKKKEICITFDELPASTSFGDVDRQAITYLTLQALKKHKVKAAGFVVGEQVGDSYDILGEWLNEGHILGNMTYSNQDLNELDTEDFISNIGVGSEALETMLNGFGQKYRYFRFPYLHYGNTAEKKKEVTIYLEDNDYIVAHVTVTVEDYLYNLSMEKLGKTQDSSRYKNLMVEYVNHVTEAIVNNENLSMQVLKRPCKQILQLRANRLNAVFLDEILTAIENLGYKYITLDKALDDELFGAPEAYFGLRGVGYLEMIRDSDPDYLPAE